MKTLNRLARSKPFIAFTAATLLGGTIGLTQLATAANDSGVQYEPIPVASFDLTGDDVRGTISPDLSYSAVILPNQQPATGSGTVSEVTFQFSNVGASALTIDRFEFRYAQDSPFSYQVGSATLDGLATADPTVTIPPEAGNPVSGEWAAASWTVPAQDTTPGILVLKFNMLVAAQSGGPYTLSFYGDEGGDTFGPENVTVTMIAGPTATPVEAQGSRGQNISVAPSATAAPGETIDQAQTCLSVEETLASCTATIDLGPTVGNVSFDVDQNLFTFVPFENFTGEAVAYYQVTDSLGQKANATATFSSRPPPTAGALTQTTTVNVPVELTPNGTAASGLTINAAATCVRATVDGACGASAALGTSGLLSYDVGTGKITFSPAVGFLGIAEGFYSVSDNLGGQGTGTITVQVADGTTAGNVTLSVANNGTGSVDPIVALAPGASVTATCVKTTVDSEVCGETATVAGGTFGYNSETNKLTFTSNGEAATNPIIGYYQVTDSNAAAAVGQISVTVVPNPTVNAVTLSTGAGVPASRTLTGTPASGQTIVTADTCIQETVDGTCGASVNKSLGNFTVSNSQLTFTPANATDTGTVSIYYRVKDGLGGRSAPAEITVTIIGKPTVTALTAATTKGTSEVILTPTATAATGATLDNSKTCVRQTQDGACSSTVTVTPGGQFEFLPALNKIRFAPSPAFSGTASAFYRVEDNLGSTATASVTVTVAAFTPESRPEVPATPGTPKEVANIASLAGTGYNANTVQVSIDNGLSWSSALVNDPSKGAWTVDTGKVIFTPILSSSTTVATALARIQGSAPAMVQGKVKASASVNEFKVYSLSVNITATPTGAPGRATGVNAQAGNGYADVSWTAPTDPGASAITGYTVTSNPGSKTCTTTGATSCRVEGLTNGTAYTFTVVAANAQGSGLPSDASPSVTPSASAVTVPGAPTNVVAIAGDGKVTVEWSAPASNGGAAITNYTVTSNPGSKTCTTTGSLTCVVSGLTNGTAYTFTVVATNSVGQGLPSTASNSATPTATPGPEPSPTPTPGPTVVPVPVPDNGGGGTVVPVDGGGSLPKTGADILAQSVLGIMFVILGLGVIAINQRKWLFARGR